MLLKKTIKFEKNQAHTKILLCLSINFDEHKIKKMHFMNFFKYLYKKNSKTFDF